MKPSYTILFVFHISWCVCMDGCELWMIDLCTSSTFYMSCACHAHFNFYFYSIIYLTQSAGMINSVNARTTHAAWISSCREQGCDLSYHMQQQRSTEQSLSVEAASKTESNLGTHQLDCTPQSRYCLLEIGSHLASWKCSWSMSAWTWCSPSWRRCGKSAIQRDTRKCVNT